MKNIICILAIVGFASANDPAKMAEPLATRSISSMIEDFIAGLRDQMPCGFPNWDIPPLAPLFINGTDIKIDYQPSLLLDGDIQNFYLNGLNNFTATVKVNLLKKKVDFEFLFDDVNFDTFYNAHLYLKKAGFTINLVGAGQARLALKRLQIAGTLKYSFGIWSQKLQLKTLKTRLEIDDVDSNIEGLMGDGGINHKLNGFLEEAIQMAINDYNDLLSQAIQDNVFPPVNAILSQYRLKDVVRHIVGSGGGSNDPGNVCKPTASLTIE